jgi:hypothetical protein
MTAEQRPKLSKRRAQGDNRAERNRLEEALEIGLEDTFPASDAVAAVQPTGKGLAHQTHKCKGGRVGLGRTGSAVFRLHGMLLVCVIVARLFQSQRARADCQPLTQLRPSTTA